jgi:hypothetical protein
VLRAAAGPCNALAGNLFDLVGRRIVPHGETKNLRRRAGNRRHRQFAFPSLQSQPFFEIFWM